MASKFLKSFSLLSGGLLIGTLLGANVGAIADRAPATIIPLQQLRTFTEIWTRVKEAYVEPVDDQKLFEGAITGMLSSLDPHSAYLDKEAYKELSESMKGQFGGLGMQVDMDTTGYVLVTAPIEDTPAARAGIKAGDLIFKIDGVSVKGLTLDQAVKRLRGDVGTSVVITVYRAKDPQPQEIRLTRDIIRVPSIKFQLLDDGYGYVRIIQFQEDTTADLNKALIALYKDNKAPLKGLLLDLRNDPGGQLTSAIGVSSAFLPPDVPVVLTDGRLPDSKKTLIANRANYTMESRRSGDDPLAGLPPEAKTVPLVVLINGYSASASEIVAGALQDHKRAIIAGTRSFGKGSVQTVLPMNDGAAIKMTTSRYFTPTRRSIQAKGITPDVVIEAKDENGKVINDRLVSEADLAGHLSNPNGGEEDKSKTTASDRMVSQPVDEKPRQPRKRERDANGQPVLVSKDDDQLMQAISVLKVQQLLLSKMAPAATAPAKPAAK